VRGTEFGALRIDAQARFIPACAGNSHGCGWPVCSQAVHPRVCGEQWEVRDLLNDGTGSSPRVRGTGRPTFRPVCWQRFIPACAGNSCSRRLWEPQSPVHPRVCGEQQCCALAESGCFGSSPRVRGTDSAGVIATGIRRFIPACAGNSRFHGPPPEHQPVHPRVCGEQHIADPDSNLGDGSSPRVRGTVAGHTPNRLQDRFIPACAGNRFVTRRSAASNTVHPRVCGEQH